MCDMCLRHVSPPRELVCVYVSYGYVATHHLVSMLVHMAVHVRMHMCLHICIRSAQDVAVLIAGDKKAIHNMASCTYKRKLTELKDAYMLKAEKKRIAGITAKEARDAETLKRTRAANPEEGPAC